MKSTELFNERIIRQIKNGWIAQNKLISDFMNKYADEAYETQVAPERNRALYILGHVVSASDGLFPMFGAGERKYPELEKLFTNNPDRTFVGEYPSITSLRIMWNDINEKLSSLFESMTTEDWMSKHTKVSEEDFKTDPLRNKLNVLIGRITHMNYHLGQLNISPLTKA